ncbi:PFL_4703 family integrating conjugative element protein [Vibrio mediterranei]|jgi:integrating conjugative element protein (TIGR03746 family)|uniref:PFL_4703 family integrating conjugative element protein n=1 Tax=Vibrio mediterranei TaxID=689 RepID=UPI0038CE0FE1
MSQDNKARFRSALMGRDAHIRSLRVALGLMTGVTLAVTIGWLQAGQDFTVHMPPDLSSGSSRPWWEVPKPNVYDFAVNLFGQINRWQQDGSKDYANNLHLYSHYLTPQCKKVLQQDKNNKQSKGELSGRERSLAPIPGFGYADWRVTTHSKDSWTVEADFELKEYVGGVLVKHNFTRWPLRIVRYDIDVEQNPWQLAIDCFSGPAREIHYTKENNAS